MEHIMFSLEAVLPTFIIIAIGFLLKRKNFISPKFVSEASTVAFYIGFPCNVFKEITSYGKPSELLNPRFVIFICAMTVIFFLGACLVTPAISKQERQRGAIIHGIFRSNYIVMGSMLAATILGDTGSTSLVTLYPFIVPLFITLAVIAFALHMPSGDNSSKPNVVQMILRNIIRTPIMWGAMAGLVVAWSGITLPTVFNKTIGTAASLATPLSLLALGGQLDFSTQKFDFKTASAVSALKLIVLPTIAVSFAVFLGFSGAEIGATLIVFGTPVALTGFVLSKQMHSDYELTSQLILITLFFSAFTLFFGILILRMLGCL